MSYSGMKVRRYTDAEVLANSEYLVQNVVSLEEAEKQIGVPHSTLFWHIQNRLIYLDETLYNECCELFNLNKQIRNEKIWEARRAKRDRAKELINNIK